MSILLRDVAGFTCNGPLVGGTGLNLAEAKRSIQDFCLSLSQRPISPGNNQTTTYRNSLGNSNMQISVTYTTDTTCDQSETATFVIDELGCQNTFYQLVEECDKDAKGYLGKYGGSNTTGCGVFTISTAVEEEIRCGGNPYGHSSDMYKEAVARAMDEYCEEALTLEPGYQKPVGFVQDAPKGESYANVMSEGLMVRLATQFSDQGQEGCSPSAAFQTKGDECRRKLQAIWDECGGPGGGLSENGRNGCVVWTMWGQRF